MQAAHGMGAQLGKGVGSRDEVRGGAAPWLQDLGLRLPWWLWLKMQSGGRGS